MNQEEDFCDQTCPEVNRSELISKQKSKDVACAQAIKEVTRNCSL